MTYSHVEVNQKYSFYKIVWSDGHKTIIGETDAAIIKKEYPEVSFIPMPYEREISTYS
jgi:hypothetical protein